MRKAGSTWSLILGSNVVPKVHRCDWSGAINHGDQAKAVGEPALLQWDWKWTRHACLPPLDQRDQRKEERTEKPNGQPLSSNDQRGAAIGGECAGACNARHVADLLKVESASKAIRQAEASTRLDPPDCGASQRERNKESWPKAARCTARKKRSTEKESGGKARCSGTLAARDLLRADIAGASDIFKLHADIVAASGVLRR